VISEGGRLEIVKAPIFILTFESGVSGVSGLSGNREGVSADALTNLYGGFYTGGFEILVQVEIHLPPESGERRAKR